MNLVKKEIKLFEKDLLSLKKMLNGRLEQIRQM